MNWLNILLQNEPLSTETGVYVTVGIIIVIIGLIISLVTFIVRFSNRLVKREIEIENLRAELNIYKEDNIIVMDKLENQLRERIEEYKSLSVEQYCKLEQLLQQLVVKTDKFSEQINDLARKIDIHIAIDKTKEGKI